MITRRTWVAAHVRRLPQADAFARVHAELEDAYRLDQALFELQRELENSDLTQEQVARVEEWV